MYLFFRIQKDWNISNVDQIELHKKVPNERREKVNDKTYKDTYTSKTHYFYELLSYNSHTLIDA